jgi:drug/metabolite transporter (DMT)-like permease
LIPGIGIPILLSLFALLTQGLADFSLKQGVALRGNPFSVMSVTCPAFILTSALSGVLLGALHFSGPTLQFGLLTGILSFVSMNLFVISLQGGEASVNTMLFRLNFIVTSLLSIYFLHESAGWAKWLGLGLAVGAVYTVALRGGPTRTQSPKSTLLVIAALVIYGVNAYVFKVASINGVKAPGLAVVTSSIFWFLSFLVHALPWSGFRIQLSSVVIRFGSLAGFLQALAINSIIWALTLGAEASVVIPILQLSFVLTSALAVLTLHEAVNGRKILGFAMGISALVVLAL